ncbi:MAG: Asp23/Gls24 family envelope stress response protein [Clostridia bacterium]|nr:Asp23/Gls24 family envelope stress response protein [Clostridia bacterium]
MAHFKKVPQKAQVGKIVYGNSIVDDIVFFAVMEIPYIELHQHSHSRAGGSYKVFFDKEGIRVDVAVKIHYTQSVSEMAFRIQDGIRHAVESMTDYHVYKVNVTVLGVLFNEITEVKEEPKEELKEEVKED